MLALSSDQPKNTTLVSGDTAGWLQIWDICHFAVDIQNQVRMCVHCSVCRKCVLYSPIYLWASLSTQPVCERPPLLQCWKAHQRAVVSVEVLELADRLFVLTASADGTVGLWTKYGDHVGSFGQEVMWNITEPAAYQR